MNCAHREGTIGLNWLAISVAERISLISSEEKIKCKKEVVIIVAMFKKDAVDRLRLIK